MERKLFVVAKDYIHPAVSQGKEYEVIDSGYSEALESRLLYFIRDDGEKSQVFVDCFGMPKNSIWSVVYHNVGEGSTQTENKILEVW